MRRHFLGSAREIYPYGILPAIAYALIERAQSNGVHPQVRLAEILAPISDYKIDDLIL